jgi:hypothetical protein
MAPQHSAIDKFRAEGKRIIAQILRKESGQEPPAGLVGLFDDYILEYLTDLPWRWKKQQQLLKLLDQVYPLVCDQIPALETAVRVAADGEDEGNWWLAYLEQHQKMKALIESWPYFFGRNLLSMFDADQPADIELYERLLPSLRSLTGESGTQRWMLRFFARIMLFIDHPNRNTPFTDAEIEQKTRAIAESFRRAGLPAHGT